MSEIHRQGIAERGISLLGRSRMSINGEKRVTRLPKRDDLGKSKVLIAKQKLLREEREDQPEGKSDHGNYRKH